MEINLILGHALLSLFTTRSSQDFAGGWAFGPKELKNIQTLLTLTTVAIATKNLSTVHTIPTRQG